MSTARIPAGGRSSARARPSQPPMLALVLDLRSLSELRSVAVMGYAGFSVRLSSDLMDRARRVAAAMSKLSRYELLGISPKTVLRIALVEGADLVNQADPRCLRPEHAAALRDRLETQINNQNVMLTDTCYVDLVFMTKVVEWGHVRASLDEGKGTKEVGVEIRLPSARLPEVHTAIAKGLKQGIPSRSAMIRILLEAGLVKLEARSYWDKRREGFVEDRAGDLQPPRARPSAKKGKVMLSGVEAVSTFHRLFVYSLADRGQRGFEVLVKPDLDQPGAASERPTVFRCSNAKELRSCFEALGVDGASRQLGERAHVPVFLQVPCSVEEAVSLAKQRPSCTFIASNSTIGMMRERIAAVKATGIAASDRVSI